MRESRRPAKDIFLHIDNHPKLKQANELIKQACILEREVKEEQDGARKNLKPEYSYKVTVNIEKESSWFSGLPGGTETLHIQATLLNKAVFDSHIHYYGSLYNPPEDSKSSLKYYRKHGVLFHTGGGHHLLNDEKPCSAKDWKQFKNGSIPKKFKR